MDSRAAEGWWQRLLGFAAVFGVMHATVDAACIGLLVWQTREGAMSWTGEVVSSVPGDVIWGRFLVYNTLAFGTQFSIGAIADRWKAYRGTLAAGFALLLVAMAVGPRAPVAALALAALGNAAFHIGAGSLVLLRSSGRTGPSGMFVGPGAIGVAIGIWWGRSPDGGPWIFLGPLLACAIAAYLLMKGPQERCDDAVGQTSLLSTLAASLCAAAMILAVTIRSLNGQAVSAVHEGEAGTLWGLALAACAGNILGGFVADRVGWLATCLWALVLSAPLLAFFVDRPSPAIAGTVLFQMTMPVTLFAIWHMFPREPGLTFGLAALGVLIGVVPFFIWPPQSFTSGAMLAGMTAASLAAISAGLPPILRLRNS